VIGTARGALRGLTTRGRSFAAAGAATTVAAVALGQRDLLRVGVLLATLPLVSAWVVARTRYRLACSRRLEPARVPAGQPSSVVVRLDNVSRLPTGLLLVEDRVPYALGSRPALRARPGRAARPPGGVLCGPLRRAGGASRSAR
jgi:hypothetical protein